MMDKEIEDMINHLEMEECSRKDKTKALIFLHYLYNQPLAWTDELVNIYSFIKDES